MRETSCATGCALTSFSDGWRLKKWTPGRHTYEKQALRDWPTAWQSASRCSPGEIGSEKLVHGSGAMKQAFLASDLAGDLGLFRFRTRPSSTALSRGLARDKAVEEGPNRP